MKLSKKMAVVLAGALTVGGAAAIVAPSAQAFGPTSVTVPGSLFLGNAPATTNATTNNTLTDTITLTTTPSGTVNAGNVVTVNVSGANGPSTGPVGLNANAQVIRGLVELTGAMTGDVGLNQANIATCNYPATNIGTNSPQGPWSTSGTFTATGNGATQVRLKQIFFDDQGNKDGSIANNCAGTANNADYYISPGVTQTAGSGLPGLTKTAPASNATIFEPLNIVGPNATAGIATFQTVAGYVRGGSTVTIPLTGTVWGSSVAVGGFTAEFCNTAGASCDAAVTNTLSTDGSGNLTGTVSAPASLTTGNRAIKLTQGANTSLTPIVVLAAASISLSPSSGGPGTSVAVTGSNWNPTQTVTIRGALAAFSFLATTDASITTPASGTGTFSASYTVNDPNTLNIVSSQGIPGPPSPGNPSAFAPFTVNQDRCVAYNSNLTGGPGCNTKQNVNVSVLQGRLVQRAYVNTTATTGSTDGSAITSPIQGTSNANPDATTVNLGTITVPLAPATIVGNLNDITVSDNRGGSFGWTLSATMPNFTGSPNANTIANTRLSATPSCAPATNATAWDYTAVGKTAIAGFDDTLNAPGVTAGAAAQNFGGTVNLCTKDTTENATTQTTGGVYNVTSTLTLVVPAFQAADRYTSTITVLLA